jgi:transposase
MPSPKLAPLVLSAEERQVLEGWARRRKTSQALALRSRIVLASADGVSVTAMAADLGVSRDTVRKWRSRFMVSRLEGLSDEPRPGAPRTITDEQVELVIAKTLEERGPGEDTHWSTRSMAAATGMSQSAVSRIWRAFGLKPHLVQTWKLSDCISTLLRRPWYWQLMRRARSRPWTGRRPACRSCRRLRRG